MVQKIVANYRCGKRVTTTGCTEDRVNLSVGSGHCKMCYRNQSNELSAPNKRKNCNSSRLGCPVCKETICGDCWMEGYDMHAKRATKKGGRK